MNAEELRALQTPWKTRYREDPGSARKTLVAEGSLDVDQVACQVKTSTGIANAGLHPAAGGDGSFACAGDMLLQALVGCAGTTLAAVAAPPQNPIRRGTNRAGGVFGFPGSLRVGHDVGNG